MTSNFPTRDTCDLDEPREMFLPLLVALPIGDYRIALPVVYLRLVSERFHQLGAFMRCPECGHTRRPKKVWQAPSATTPHWLSDPGRWEPVHLKQPAAVPKRSSKFAHIIPTREQCDLDEPREMFAWMFAGLPMMNGAPMLFDGDWAQDASEHLYDGGAMLKCPECAHVRTPEKEYVPPDLSGPKWLTSPGEWVAYGDKPARTLAEEIDVSLNKMGQRQQAELLKALAVDEQGGDLPDTPAGDVVSRMPAELKAAVLTRLRERD